MDVKVLQLLELVKSLSKKKKTKKEPLDRRVMKISLFLYYRYLRFTLCLPPTPSLFSSF